MNKRIVITSTLILLMLGGALVYRAKQADQNQDELIRINQSALQNADGKDGRNCWLAVDGVVYEIEQGYKWNDGEHTESSSAYCGADMSAVIDSAPHGRTKLSQLKKVGTLEK